MPHIHINGHKPAAALVLILVSLVLVACGGSSTSSSTNAAVSASKTTTGGGATTGGAGGGRFAAVRECLQKNGITLPKRAPGQGRGPGTGGLLGGATAPKLPSGVTRAQYEAALKKCGGSPRGLGARRSSPAFKQSLTKFAVCMREHGVQIGEPNTSGKGPIFNTSGINTTSAQFKTAQTTCTPNLRAALPGAPGGRPPAGEAP
jgi:hypothetical protein